MYNQAAAISYDIPGIIYVKKKKQFLFCRGMCTDRDIAKCLISFHVMTGCDANSYFLWSWKNTSLRENGKARRLHLNCGESLPLNDVLEDISSYVNGDAHSFSLDLALAAKWKGQKKKSLKCLPPDDDSPQHIQRHPDMKIHPSPIRHG